MNGLKYFFIVVTFILSFLLFYSSLRIFSDHRRWIRDYFIKERHRKQLEQHFSQLLLQLSSFLKAGYALPQALNTISATQTGRLLSEALRSQKKEIPRAYATSGFSPRNDNVGFLIAFLKQAIFLSSRNGIPLSPLFEKISRLYQTEGRFREKIALLTFPAKTQAIIAVLLPWFVLTIVGLIAPDLVIETLKQKAGVVGFSTAFVLDGVALKWVQKIIHS